MPEEYGPQWDAKAGNDAGISWRVYHKNCVGICFGPAPSMTAGELANLIVRLSYIARIMNEP